MCIGKNKKVSRSSRLKAAAEVLQQPGAVQNQPNFDQQIQQLPQPVQSSQKELSARVQEGNQHARANKNNAKPKDGDGEHSLKKDPPVPPKDILADKMSADNTLKEVPNRMPECDFTHTVASNEPIFTNDQLL